MLEAVEALSEQAEAFAATRRFWFRSKDVALGLFPAEGPGLEAIRYWKFHRDGKWRRRSFAEDRKLFAEGGSPESLGIAPALLSYKPESRVAWKFEREGEARVAKLYSPSTYARAEAGARIWAGAEGGGGARLIECDRERRTVVHEFAGETASAAAVRNAEPPREFHRLARGAADPALAGGVPTLLPIDICRHLRQRVEAHAQWIPRVAPDCAARLHEIRERAQAAADAIFKIAPLAEPVLLHGDFRPKNLVARDSADLKWIDYDHVVWGDPEWDLAAWQADTGRTLEPAAEICLARLAGYGAAWRVLLELEAIEERRAA